ncbi:MAG TPA: HIT family protein [Chitinophagaceae bacterium]|jgi:histidine triad (HIT) family protein|nr:HIT family protein [Chitinophagaceae bacterium]
MTLFSKIIAGEIPAFRVAENDRFFAFLDVFPLRRGHTLVIPKEEVDRFIDMPEESLREILLFARPIALAIEKAFPCARVGYSVIGLEVPHAHLHLVPMDSAHDLNFTRPKLTVSPEELAEDQRKLLEAMK